MRRIEFETDLRLRGDKIAALFCGTFDLNSHGQIDEIWVSRGPGKQPAYLDGELFELMRATLEVDYADLIEEALAAMAPVEQPDRPPIRINAWVG